MATYTPLNWKELKKLVDGFRGQLEGLFLDRIIVPERPRYPEKYLKGEWCLRFTGRKSEVSLLVSIRPRRPYLAFDSAKGPKAAATATRSPFDLALSKWLRGQKLLEIQTLPRERTVILWFTVESNTVGAHRQGLTLAMVPAAPEALLILDTSLQEASRTPEEAKAEPALPGFQVLVRSRANKSSTINTSNYLPPDGSKAPLDLALREELVSDPGVFLRAVEESLALEAFDLRLKAAQKEFRALLKHATDRIRQNETSVQEAEKEADWQRYGDLLKGSLHLLKPEPALVREVMDYEFDCKVEIPCDPKLNPSDQIAKFYQLARRKKRRLEEAQARLNDFLRKAGEIEALLKGPQPAPGDWNSLEAYEKRANIRPEQGVGAGGEPSPRKRAGGWLGKVFESRDGLAIWVGRSRDENLELTFKHARGNDLWLHVRGRPGAHAVIPLQPGKSAPLETLLDAAALTVFYSGGEKWGKTEVDYTFKKHVRRIKDSTEASYTHNKTLIIEPDATRLKRLLAQNP